MPCPKPYELLGPVRILRKDLGLTTNDLAVLTALISYLPRQRHDTTRRNDIELTVVFPSNASLSQRANGIDERTLRRSLGRLAAAKLIERKNSANGKRFPLRYEGVIRDAFGIDLKPLLQSYDTLAARASKLTEAHERLRSLKSEALALRASLLQDMRLNEAQLSNLAVIKNLLRRASLTADAVLRIISSLRELGADGQASHGERLGSAKCLDNTREEAFDEPQHEHFNRTMPARNGQNDRHIESIEKEFKDIPALTTPTTASKTTSTPSTNKDPATMAWEDFTHVASFFPEAPQTGEALTRVLFDLGRMLRIRQEKLVRCLQSAGAGRLLLIFDYLLRRADAIRQPEAYLETILRA
jgi:replication initiation protein RepC